MIMIYVDIAPDVSVSFFSDSGKAIILHSISSLNWGTRLQEYQSLRGGGGLGLVGMIPNNYCTFSVSKANIVGHNVLSFESKYIPAGMCPGVAKDASKPGLEQVCSLSRRAEQSREHARTAVVLTFQQSSGGMLYVGHSQNVLVLSPSPPLQPLKRFPLGQALDKQEF